MIDSGSFGAPKGQPVPLRQWEVSTRQVGKITNPLAGICFFLVTFGFYGWYWAYVNHRDLQATTGGGLGALPGLLLWIFFPIVNIFALPAQVDDAFSQRGLSSPVSAVTGFWVFLPLLGWIVWYVKLQRALNSLWQGLRTG